MKQPKNYGKYRGDEDSYAGEYIAVANGKIIAHGKEPRGVYESAVKFCAHPMLAKVPTGGWKEMRVL